MDIINNITKPTLIICDNNYKKRILFELNKINKLYSIKFMTMQELIKCYYFDYNEKSIYYLMHKYNIKYDIAKIYINNMYYVDNIKYNSDKLNDIVKYKQELINNDLLIFDTLFKDLIKDKDIIIYNQLLNKFQTNLVKELEEITNVNIINDKLNMYQHEIYKFYSLDEEVEYVAYKICELLKNGIDINNIKLSNISNDYYSSIERIFNLYNIPINIDYKYPIYSTKVVKDFINNYNSDISITIDSLKQYEGNNIYNKIVDICNKYRWCNDYNDVIDLIKYDLNHTYIDNTKYNNAVEIIDYKDKLIKDEYVFLMNFNLGSIPKIYKDEDFITDSLKDNLLLDNTVEKNIREKQDTINSINNIKNLVITFKVKTPTSDYYPSNLVELYTVEEDSIDINKSYSKLNNQLKLAKLYDDLVKYGSKNDTLSILNNNYSISYLKYNNKYNKINVNDMYKYLNNRVNLSYTTLNCYNECSFKYYLSNILKLNIFEDNFAAILGTIFHYVLEHGIKREINIDEEINNCINTDYKDRVFTNKEKFFIEKMKPEIQFVLNTIKEQMKYSSLDSIETEKAVYINNEKNIKTNFTGIIDKMLYKIDNDITYVALVDYKTGSTKIDLTLVPYGINMQLPIYMYLCENIGLPNVKIVGIYLQKVMPKLDKIDFKNTVLEIKKNNLKLEGYSNSDRKALEKLDSEYDNSMFIKSMKINKDGSFSRYAKVLSDDQINTIISKVKEQIDKCFNNIIEGNFDINPKKISKDKDILGCNYCKYKDICFRTNNDIVKIEPDIELSYLGGDNND